MTAREPRRDGLERESYLMLQLVGRRLAEQLDAVCREQGLTEAQYAVLWVVCLADEPDGIVQGSISDGLVTRAADVSRILGRLEAAGLVTRDRDAVDGRVLRVRPTRQGRVVFERATEQVKALHRRQFRGFADHDLRSLVTALNQALWEPEAP